MEEINIKNNMAEWTLYLDESGNTGTNMLDENQPFYVYAGWLVNNDDKNNVINYIQESFKKVNAQELKSVNIIKRYRPQLYNFLQNAIHNGMHPFYYVFEKKYYICCKIVETFFDYAHNKNVPIQITFDYERKKEICNAIYGNTELLEIFSHLLTESTITIEEMQKAKELLVNSMNSFELLSYKRMVSNVTNDELYDMISEFECLAEGDNKIRQSPGGTELFSLINEVEKLMKIENKTAKIVVDELAKKTFINDIKSIIDNRSLFTQIIDLETEKSNENIIIQAADLLSGYTNAVYKNDFRIDKRDSDKINALFDVYNETLLKCKVCPLKFSSYEE